MPERSAPGTRASVTSPTAAAPSRPQEPAPEASAPAAEAAEPAPPPVDPRTLPPSQAWRHALASLSPLSRVLVEDNAAFQRYADGKLVLAARSERLAGQVRERVREAEFGRCLAGFRNVEVLVDEGGRTGNEARAAGDEKRRAQARAAAEASPLVKQLCAAFGATLDTVEVLSEAPPELIFEEEVPHEE